MPPQPPSPDLPIVSVGDLVTGKFRVERVLGEGGMGVVVAARHVHLDERVALKFLRPGMMNPEMVARFAQEARAAVKLKSEHVARVIDVGTREDGLPFIVMEYLEGQDLGSLLRENGPLAPEIAADLAIQACEGLAEAHSRGIVHRDIKLENLFLAEHSDGWRTLKILDFGISKAMAARTGAPSADANIRTQQLMGSPCYMSPEQLRSTQSVDHRTDIWSLGVVLYELLTGVPAYDPERALSEVIAIILETEPPRVRARRPDVPAALDEIVAHCMERDRDKRLQNAAELAIALLHLAPRRSRVKVERAVAVTHAAGLSDGRLSIPSSLAPPPGDDVGALPSFKSPTGRPSRGPKPVPAGRPSMVGSYRLVASLSPSSLWETFLAVPLDAPHDLVTVKRLRQALADDAAVRAEFTAQARRSLALQHPHAVRTRDVVDAGEAPFVVTDYLEIQSLDTVVWSAKRAGLRLAPETSARLVADVCSALDAAHSLSPSALVHGHLNPRNVLVTYDGASVVVDFGLARCARPSAHAALLRDTAGYVAPEVLRGQLDDPRSDVFAAGVILWELLADRRLRGDLSDSALLRTSSSTAPNLTDLVNDVPSPLAAIVARALHKDPSGRFQSAREMREALEAHLATAPLPAHSLGEQMQGLFTLARLQARQEVDLLVQRAQRAHIEGAPTLAPPRQYDSRAETLAPLAEGSSRAVTATAGSPPKSRRRAVGILAALLVAAALGLLWFRSRPPAVGTPTLVAGPQPSTAATGSADVAPAPSSSSATAVASSDPTATLASSSPTASSAPSAPPGPRKGGAVGSPVPPRPRPAGTPASPGDPGLDIRMQR